MTHTRQPIESPELPHLVSNREPDGAALSAAGSKPCGDPSSMGVSNPPDSEDYPAEPQDGEVDPDYMDEPRTRTEDPDYAEEPIHGEEEPGFIDEPRGEKEGDYVEEPIRDVENPGYPAEPPPKRDARSGAASIPPFPFPDGANAVNPNAHP